MRKAGFLTLTAFAVAMAFGPVVARQEPVEKPPAAVPVPKPASEQVVVKISGEMKVEPYRQVRLSALNVPSGAGVDWWVEPAFHLDGSPRVDWATGTDVVSPKWVAPPGVYRVELIVVTVEASVPKLKRFHAAVTIGTPPAPGPTPPTPTPGPGPGPGPTPPTPTPTPPDPNQPVPIEGPGNRCLIIYESAMVPKMPASQAAILNSANLREYLDAKTIKEPLWNPDGAYRIWDRDVDLSHKSVSDSWRKAMARAKEQATAWRAANPTATLLGWIAVSNGTTGFEGPLPADTTQTMVLCEMYFK